MTATLDGKRAFQQTRHLDSHGHFVCGLGLEDARRALAGLLDGPELILEAAVAFTTALRYLNAVALRESITLIGRELRLVAGRELRHTA